MSIKPKTNEQKFAEYMGTYSGKNLKYPLSQEGTWRIRGEDSNCDLGGSHYMPELAIVEGKLEDVIRYGVQLPGFWQWGGGGDFTLISKPIKITAESNYQREMLLAEAADLRDQLAKVEKQLEAL